MQGRAVSHIRGESIAGISAIELADHGIALNLGDDRGGGDGGRNRVAVENSRLVALKIDAQRIDEQVVRSRRKLGDSFFHCLLRRPIDVDRVDGGDIDASDRPSDAILANAGRKLLARLTVEQLRVAQPANTVVGLENDGGRYYRAKEAAAADFVHAGDQPRTFSPSQFLVLQRALELFKKAQFLRGLGDFCVIFEAKSFTDSLGSGCHSAWLDCRTSTGGKVGWNCFCAIAGDDYLYWPVITRARSFATDGSALPINDIRFAELDRLSPSPRPSRPMWVGTSC